MWEMITYAMATLGSAAQSGERRRRRRAAARAAAPTLGGGLYVCWSAACPPACLPACPRGAAASLPGQPVHHCSHTAPRLLCLGAATAADLEELQKAGAVAQEAGASGPAAAAAAAASAASSSDTAEGASGEGQVDQQQDYHCYTVTTVPLLPPKRLFCSLPCSSIRQPQHAATRSAHRSSALYASARPVPSRTAAEPVEHGGALPRLPTPAPPPDRQTHTRSHLAPFRGGAG